MQHNFYFKLSKRYLNLGDDCAILKISKIQYNFIIGISHLIDWNIDLNRRVPSRSISVAVC